MRAYRNKEVWLIRVKENRLDRTLDLFERRLRVAFCDLVDPNATVAS